MAWHHASFRLETWRQLRAEVNDGKSIVLLNEQRELERLISVVSIKIEDASGRVFAQLGKPEDFGVLLKCQLPSFKQRRDETIDEVVEKIINERLAPLSAYIELTGNLQVEISVDNLKMREGIVSTEYLLSVHSARLLEGSDAVLTSLVNRRHGGNDIYLLGREDAQILCCWLRSDQFENWLRSGNADELRKMLDSCTVSSSI